MPGYNYMLKLAPAAINPSGHLIPVLFVNVQFVILLLARALTVEQKTEDNVLKKSMTVLKFSPSVARFYGGAKEIRNLTSQVPSSPRTLTKYKTNNTRPISGKIKVTARSTSLFYDLSHGDRGNKKTYNASLIVGGSCFT